MSGSAQLPGEEIASCDLRPCMPRLDVSAAQVVKGGLMCTPPPCRSVTLVTPSFWNFPSGGQPPWGPVEDATFLPLGLH